MITNKLGRLPLRGTVAASPSGLSRLRRLRGVASTIAGALFLVAFLFLIIFGLPGLFAGV